jgi:hypothetical protein
MQFAAGLTFGKGLPERTADRLDHTLSRLIRQMLPAQGRKACHAFDSSWNSNFK